jgi:hypothetical protein
MFERCEIEFNNGEILTASILRRLYEYPNIALETKYNSYSTGIIYGAELIKESDKLVLTPGLVKLKEKIYFLQEKYIFSDDDFDTFSDGDEISVIAEETTSAKNHGLKTICLQISLKKKQKNEYENIELICFGSFMYRKEVLPRSDYKSFSDLNNENFIKLSSRSISHIDYPTYDSRIIYFFCLEFIKKEKRKDWDHIILSLGLNKNIISKDCVVMFLEVHGCKLSAGSNIVEILDNVLQEKIVCEIESTQINTVEVEDGRL